MEGNYIKRERVSKLIQVVKSGMYSVLRLPSAALVNLKKRPIYSAISTYLRKWTIISSLRRRVRNSSGVKVTKHVHTE